MNLKELKHSVDFAVENLQDYQNPEVLITLSENSIGSRASAKVKYVGLGFDWESGQFRIESDKPIVSKGNTFKDVKEIRCGQFGGRKYYSCPRCEGKVSKGDNFCRSCGQTLAQPSK